MSSRFDEDLQHVILEELEERYPAFVNFYGDLHAASFPGLSSLDVDRVSFNLAYLEDKGLLKVSWDHTPLGSVALAAKIVAKGIDHLRKLNA